MDLIYSWWNLYLRLYDEEHHREAIRTRPMLMSGVGARSKAVVIEPSKSAPCMKKPITSKSRPHRPSRRLVQQEFESNPRHHGAMECGPTPDAAVDAFA